MVHAVLPMYLTSMTGIANIYCMHVKPYVQMMVHASTNIPSKNITTCAMTKMILVHGQSLTTCTCTLMGTPDGSKGRIYTENNML